MTEKDILLENKYVKISTVKLETDLIDLFQAASIQNNGEDLFRYHVNVPEINSIDTFKEYIETKNQLKTEILFKIFSKRLDKYVGCFSLMNINLQHSTIEIGSIWISKIAQKTEVNTNVMLLIFTYIFEKNNFRRLEWKCNNLNENSKKAAIRLGFEYEGLFRNHMISRNESRDTAWFSIIDSEWEEKKKRLEYLAR